MNYRWFYIPIFLSVYIFPLHNIYAQIADSAWPMFHHNLKHTGRSAYTGSDNNYLQWVYAVGSSTSAPAIGTDSTIYVGSYDNNLYAINPDGTLKWKYKTGDVIESSPAVGTGGTIYVGSNDDYLYAINPDGTLKWRYLTEGNVVSSPAVGTNSTVYVGSYDGHLYAINKDGTLKYEPPNLGNQIYSSPAVNTSEIIYIGSRNNSLYSFDSNLSERWHHQVFDRVDSSPAIGSDDTVYVGADKLYAFKEDSYWTYTTTNELGITSSPALTTQDNIYFGAESGFYALYSSGSTKSIVNTIGAIGRSSPAIDASGNVYICTNSGLYVLDTNYDVKWTYPIKDGDASPVIGADGTIYVHASDGNLYAVGTSSAVVKTILTDNASISVTDGKSGTITATVYDPNNLEISGAILIAAIENVLIATVTPGSATTDTNGQAVFTVNGTAVGKTNLSLTASNTSVSVPITVSPKSGLVLTALDIDPLVLSLAKNASDTITVTTLDENRIRIPNVYLSVSNNNTGSVSVEEGKVTDDAGEAAFLVTGIEKGSASITFTADTVSGTATVIVLVPDTIELDDKSLSIKEQESEAVMATVEDQNGNVMPDQVISAVSASTSIASVDSQQTTDEDGEAVFTVTGNNAGKTSVTFTSGSATASLSVVVTSDTVSAGTVTTLNATPTELSVYTGYSGTATVTALDQNNSPLSDIDINATSDNTTIATVDSTQKTGDDGEAFFTIYGISSGTTTISFAAGSVTDSLSVSVSDLTYSLTADKNELSLLVGETGTITATIVDQNSTPLSNFNIDAVSSDTGIVTVDANKTTDDNGNAYLGILGVSEGEAEVTLSAGTQTASVSVTVTRQIPFTISVSDISLQLSQCETESVTVSVYDSEDALISNTEVTASMSEEESGYPHIAINPSSVITDGSGGAVFTITGLRKGKAVVEFGAEDISKKTKVRVKKTRIVSLGTEEKIVITVLQNGEPKSGVKITAKSSDTDIVTVNKSKTTDANGEAKFIVKGAGEGSATITFKTATSTEGLVENITVIKTSQVDVSQKDLSVSAGTSQGITITATDAEGIPVTDTNVYASVISGTKIVEIVSSDQTTDENGNASITIEGKKAGRARLKVGVCGLSKNIRARVLP